MLHRGVLDRERVPDRCNGLNVRRMAVLWTCRAPSLGRHMRCELLRNALCDFTPIITATACQQSNYVERYSRFKKAGATRPIPLHGNKAEHISKRIFNVGPHAGHSI